MITINGARSARKARDTGRARRIPAIGAVAAAVALIAACSSIDSTDNSGSEGDGTEAEAEADAGDPVHGGSITIGRPADIVSLDGAVVGGSQLAFYDAIYDTLIKLDKNFEPQPQLTESWGLSDDYMSLSLTLRDDVTFHDGKQLTSADVKYSAERVVDPAVKSPQLATFASLISSIETPDDTTVEMTFSRPLPNIFDFLEMLYIVDQETVEGPAAATTANGTGPFKLAEWQPERSYTLERNDDFWGEPTYLDEVVVQVAPDPQSMVVQLESGELDAISDVPFTDVSRLEENDFNAEATAPAGSWYIAANTEDSALADPRVRQAINHAIDRERFVEQVLSGIGEATALPWPVDSPAYDEAIDDTIAFDLEEARRLLDDAGVSELSLDIWANGGQQPLVDYAQILKSDLAEIGVELNVEAPEIPRWRDLQQTGTYTGLISGPYGASNFSPASLFLLARPFKPDDNTANYTSEEYTAAVEALSTTADEAELQQAYDEFNQLFLQESFLMPLATNRMVMVSDETVRGWGERRVNGGFDLREVWIEQE
ncbi:ABC transporter substrate-binding protein [Phytoactinopolyspora endophytica]|uniref:ABC transporter substrate-binding protein n=1 Tax=Phytoactinopolyspora endophytica TaxID=1642495 RepID=UPI0013EC8A53|nr:ABC transporter substrate-binding protein [Phytoactinopolyspora endophytica]